MRLYAKIQKMDEEQRMVWGYASTESTDSQGEIIERSAIEGALEGYMKFANIREMHSMSAVGVTKEASFDEGGLFIGAKVVDDNAWKKVKEGVYKGFSVGGQATKRKGNRILQMELTEISLVDRPANPDAVFSCFKAYTGDNIMKIKSAKLAKSDKAMEAVNALGKLLGMDEAKLGELEGEAKAEAVLAAYSERGEADKEDAVAMAMDAAVVSLAESVDAMAAEGEVAEEVVEEKAEDAVAEDKPAEEVVEEKAEDAEKPAEEVVEEKAEGSEEEEAPAAAAEDKPAEEVPAEEEEAAEKVEKSAYTIAEGAELAERLLAFACQLEFVQEWGEAPVGMSNEIHALATTVYAKLAELAAFEAQRVAGMGQEQAPAEAVAAEPVAEAAAPADDMVDRAASIALTKANQMIADLSARLEKLEQAADPVRKLADRQAPRDLKPEGLQLITKGGEKVIAKSVKEAKEAGASRESIFKGVFAGAIK